MPRAVCLRLWTQTIRNDLAFARPRVGSNRAARMAIMAITTSSSIRVKPFLALLFISVWTAARAVAHDVLFLGERRVQPHRTKSHAKPLSGQPASAATARFGAVLDTCLCHLLLGEPLPRP